ncbi:hypothetical protein EYF80_008544 [Liparis tanakae]|uniref:Uncharacterized protein n=1 Tax=Liparis tanakae TaxID=230148 RepID=A0A4Z2IT95_9TELE|nr:hypothetical protein EYF80_008544 [Liparis tanakae]
MSHDSSFNLCREKDKLLLRDIVLLDHHRFLQGRGRRKPWRQTDMDQSQQAGSNGHMPLVWKGKEREKENWSTEGTRKDRELLEWLIFLQRWLSHPASAWCLSMSREEFSSASASAAAELLGPAPDGMAELPPSVLARSRFR